MNGRPVDPEAVHLEAADRLERQHALVLKWIDLLERAFASLDSIPSDAPQLLAVEEAAILDQLQALHPAPGAGHGLPARRDASRQEQLSSATLDSLQRALALNRQFAEALRAREQLVAGRLQALRGATGITSVYAGNGHIEPLRPLRYAAATA